MEELLLVIAARRLVVVSVGLVLGLLTLTGIASAHNVQLLRSDPEPEAVLPEAPAQVKTWFNEELKTQASTVQVLDAAGKQVDLGDGSVDLDDPYHASMVVSLPELPAGAYIVRWHVVLLDDDVTDGAFTFYVGQKVDVVASVALPADQPVVTEDAGLPAVWLIIGVGVGLSLLVVFVLVMQTRRKAKPA